ncbi:MAG TPA: signal peptidase I [Verrucomicrobiae bacterium]|jgi:quercetin dioxygenase-like cupin family protein|nr:signal peptidase I [Verrucomicrobiae bacterium]
MPPEFGNAGVVGLPSRGWIIGHFVEEKSVRATDAIEIKWGVHDAGPWTEWKSQPGKKTITLLLSGEFVVQFRSGKKTETFNLRAPGDFVVWEDDHEHRWKALTDAAIISVRWPSLVPK